MFIHISNSRFANIVKWFPVHDGAIGVKVVVSLGVASAIDEPIDVVGVAVVKLEEVERAIFQ
jgi:hypothetical protein